MADGWRPAWRREQFPVFGGVFKTVAEAEEWITRFAGPDQPWVVEPWYFDRVGLSVQHVVGLKAETEEKK